MGIHAVQEMATVYKNVHTSEPITIKMDNPIGARKLRISELGKVVTGKTPSRIMPDLFGSEFPFLTPTDITGNDRYVIAERYLSPQGRHFQHRLTLPSKSICVVCIGATIGKVCMTDRDSFTNQQINSIIVNQSEHDPYYIYYLMTTLRDEFKANAGGAATPIINKSLFSNIEVTVPILLEQKRIAGILSAYDDLIENCQRRIKILETMARSLYREWFVHFRFPGHENVPLVSSPLGDIPQGWAVRSFTEIAEVLSGGTPKTDVVEYWNGDIPFFTPRDTPNCFYVQNTEKNVTEIGLSKCASQLYSPDTVFITARGTVGKLALPSVPMAMNQSCYALRGKRGVSQRYLFLLTLQQVDYLKKNTGGATFDTIVVDTFRRLQIVEPPITVIASFEDHIGPLFEQMKILQRKIKNLLRTRDILLTRLLNV